MFVILWAFEVKSGCQAAFEKEYGPEGAWAEFFRGDLAYRGTRLARDTARSPSYCTLDFWASRGAYEAFREAHREEYAKIDARCAALTVQEIPLGSFEGTLADGAAL